MTDYTHLNDANYNCWILTKSIRSINESCVTENGSWTNLCKEDDFGDYGFSQGASYAAGSFAAIFSAVGFLTNMITAISLMTCQKVREQNTTPFIVSLAVCDSLFSSVVLPQLSIRFFKMNWVLGEPEGFLCKFFPVLFYGFVAATLFNLCAVTINRWVMIYFPSNVNEVFSRRNSKLFIALSWLLPLFFVLPSFFGVWGMNALECVSRSCTIIDDEHGNSIKKFLLALGVGLPFFILTFTNVSIFYKVRTISKALKQRIKDPRMIPKGLKKREQKLTKMMSLIFGCFLVTYLPSMVVKTIDDEKEFPTLHVLCYIINWSSVVMNPAIYVATQPKYRMAIKMLVIRIRYLTQPEEARRLVIQLESENKLAERMQSVGAGRGRVPHHMPESYTDDSSDRLK